MPDAKFQCAARVFLARLLEAYGKDAPEQLRLVADELEALRRGAREGKGRYADGAEAESARMG